ncbi:MAG: signal peptide peptidase SppA [Bacteroidota bacterium]
MRQFFKTLLASALGTIVGLLILSFLFFIFISALVALGGDSESQVEDKSVLHLTLEEPIEDRTSDNPLDGFDFTSFDVNKKIGLNDLLDCIDKAAADDRIKGIFLDFTSISSGMATAQTVRNALVDFRKTGKFIYAYADYYSQGAYYMASVADSIFMNPQGDLMLNGLAAEIMFFKGTLEKLEIKPQIIRHGKFKSAVEPYLLDKMSDENRRQMAELIEPIWAQMKKDIGSSRKISPEALEGISDSLSLRSPDDAINERLLDNLIYRDQFMAILKRACKIGKDANANLISLDSYADASDPRTTKSTSRDKIAVIYAVGEIANGSGEGDGIYTDDLAETIRKAREDKKVKAIVLRVNSPGGDALASEEVWRETLLAKKAKPLVVSMGDVAASGGYYISCAADKIVAQPNTITGSIGVFGLMFNAEDMLRNKLGITTDTYKTGPMTDIGSMTRPMTEQERLIIQQQVDNVYAVFTKRVADGRKMRVSQVDSIGQGRVWPGSTAKAIGLVDELGGLDTAIKLAAKLAKLKDYRIRELPAQKPLFEVMLQNMGTEARIHILGNTVPESNAYILESEKILRRRGIQAYSPVQVRLR